MKVAYYCQHVLGIGHLHRSLEICRALSKSYDTTLILGGPPVDSDYGSLKTVQLPGLKMDREFNNLIPCDPNVSLERVKELRKEQLYTYFTDHRPEIFITELYPFGRKAFRFELDPILSSIRENVLAPCRCFSSVRDILVEKKSGKIKFENRVIDTINRYFDGVLIHSDPKVLTLDTTFPRLAEITVACHYTGFISGTLLKTSTTPTIRTAYKIKESTRLIVVSIGGGNVGTELLESSIEAFHLINKDEQKYHMQLFCGPYCDDNIFKQLQAKATGSISVDRFTDNFLGWLNTADLSISMGGYNTSMNLAKTGLPSLIYPFNQNREQMIRAQCLSKILPISILSPEDLLPATLADKIVQQLECQRTETEIALDGARQTARKIKELI